MVDTNKQTVAGKTDPAPNIDGLGYLPGGDLDGLAQMRAFARHARGPSMRRTFLIDLPEICPGRVVCEATPDLSARNSMGGVHGGYAATLLDSACGNAVHTMLQPRQTYATVEMKVSYIRPIVLDGRKVQAVGKVVSMGKRIAFAAAEIFNSDNELLASASSTLAIFDAEKTKC